MVVDVAIIVVFSVVLVKATDVLVGALNRLSRETRLGTFGLTAFLIASSTSLPEMMVGITAAIEGRPDLSLGNILGSNIANASLVIGGAAVVGGSVAVVGEFLKRDFFVAFLVGALPLLLLLDGNLGRVDGLVLFLIYAVFNIGTLMGSNRRELRRREPMMRRILRRMGEWDTDREIIWLVIGIALVVVSANMVVDAMTRLTVTLGVPLFLGGILLAIGTTLPELSFEIEALKKKEAGMVYGNLLGSVVANATLILGITAMVRPIKLANGLESYLLATIAFVVVFGLLWMFVYSKKKLERWEGAVLLLVYVVFIVMEFWRGG